MFEFVSHWNKEVIEECLPIMMRGPRKKIVRMYMVSMVAIVGVGIWNQISTKSNDWYTTLLVAVMMSIFAAYIYKKINTKTLLVLLDQMEKRHQKEQLERHIVLDQGVFRRKGEEQSQDLFVKDIDYADIAMNYVVIMFKSGQCLTVRIDTLQGGSVEEFFQTIKK